MRTLAIMTCSNGCKSEEELFFTYSQLAPVRVNVESYVLLGDLNDVNAMFDEFSE